MDSIRETKGEVISLDNGCDAYFLQPPHAPEDAKKPMIVIVHGGPFGASPY